MDTGNKKTHNCFVLNIVVNKLTNFYGGFFSFIKFSFGSELAKCFTKYKILLICLEIILLLLQLMLNCNSRINLAFYDERNIFKKLKNPQEVFSMRKIREVIWCHL